MKWSEKLVCLPDLIQKCLPDLLATLLGGFISSAASVIVMKETFRHQEAMEGKRRSQEDALREADFRLDSLLRLQESILASARLTTKCAFQLRNQVESGVPILKCKVDETDDEKLSYELRMVMLMSSRVKSVPLSRACDEFRVACWDVLFPKEFATTSEDILNKLNEMGEELDTLPEVVKKYVDALTRGTDSGL